MYQEFNAIFGAFGTDSMVFEDLKDLALMLLLIRLGLPEVKDAMKMVKTKLR